MTHAGALHCSRLGLMIRRPSGLSCDMRAMLFGRVAARPAESHLDVPFLLGHVRVFSSQVDGWTALNELRPTMYLRLDGAVGGATEGYSSAGLRLFVCDPQILLT